MPLDDRQLTLSNVEPTAVFRRTAPFGLGGDAASFAWFETPMHASRVMNVQFVDAGDDLFSAWIDNADQAAQDLRTVKIDPLPPYPHAAKATQWFRRQEQRAGALPPMSIDGVADHYARPVKEGGQGTRPLPSSVL